MDRAKQTVGQNSAKVAALLVQRGVLHGDTGDVERAKQEIQQAVDMMARTQRGKEDAAATQARIGMGRIYIQAGDSQQAIEILTPIATKELKQKNVDPADVRDAVSTLAVAELNAHHYDRAEADDQRAILLDRQLLGNSHPQTGADIANLAAVKAVEGDLPEAEHLYREGRDIMLAWYGPDHPDVATESCFLASILSHEGKDDEAQPLLRDALRIQEKAYGPVHVRISFTLNTLAEIAVRQHDLATAEFDFKRALAIDRSVLGDNNYMTAVVRGNLGIVYLKQSKNVLAEATLRQSVDTLSILPPGNNLIGTARERWGRSLLALKQYGPAGIQLTLAKELLAAQPNVPPAEIANLSNDFATLAAATTLHRGRIDVATASHREIGLTAQSASQTSKP